MPSRDTQPSTAIQMRRSDQDTSLHAVRLADGGRKPSTGAWEAAGLFSRAAASNTHRAKVNADRRSRHDVCAPVRARAETGCVLKKAASIPSSPSFCREVRCGFGIITLKLTSSLKRWTTD